MIIGKEKTACGLVAALGVLGFSLMLGGCAGAPNRGEEPLVVEAEEQTVEVDGFLVRTRRDGDEIITEQYDVNELFGEAFHAFQAGNYEEALEKYGLIGRHVPGSRFNLSSLYNGGLAAERLGRWEVAAELYELLLAVHGDHEDALNARFRLGITWMELGRYEEVEELMTEVLLRYENLAHYDRVEAHIRRGMALLGLERWTEATQTFQTVLELNGRMTGRHRLADNHQFVVQAHYGIGEANHARMNEIPLVLPPSQMSVDLERKAEFHQAAQRAYIRALREHHPHWSVAAGYKIGRLYQDFYMDIFTAEIPDDLTALELEVYFEELRKKIEVLMTRAMSVYERNLSFSRRVVPVQEAEAWVEQTALHLSRMRAFLDDPVVMRRAEELVVSGGDLEDLWDTAYYARHAVEQALGQAVEAAVTEVGGQEAEVGGQASLAP